MIPPEFEYVAPDSLDEAIRRSTKAARTPSCWPAGTR